MSRRRHAWLSEREGEPIALAFTALGFNAFVVWYRIAPNRYPRPQQDVASAVAWVRAHAAETHTDPNRIAVMGFSAGGHCAGSLGVWWPKAELWAEMGLTPEQVKPNAMVLCYPVISGGPEAHRGSFECLTGSKDMSLHTQYSLDTSVTEQTPPTFLWHTWTDTCVPVENTLLMAAALRAHNVPAAVHIFPQGEHGASLCLPHHLRRQVPLPQSPRLRRMAPNGRRVLGKGHVRYAGGLPLSQERSASPGPPPEERLAFGLVASTELVPPESRRGFLAAWSRSRRLTEPPRPCGTGKRNPSARFAGTSLAFPPEERLAFGLVDSAGLGLRLRIGVVSCELVEVTAADRAAATVRHEGTPPPAKRAPPLSGEA